jgi:NAD(P)-dependent dehydrogenase (short-subunit alcohol dehydrogenase family)
MAKVPRSLAGLNVAITGGARGIGRATAKALLAQGARVAIGDIEQPLAEQTASELGAGTVGLYVDVTDRQSFSTFLGEVEKQLGPLDVLINNAGIMPLGELVSETDQTTERIIDINVHGVIIGSKLAIERFLPRHRGHIVEIASAAGKIGFSNAATYCASKHAVVGLAESLRQELKGTGIDVSVVMPTVVNTELGSGLGAARAFSTVEPEDVADAIVEALQTNRFDVFVPKSLGATIRSGNVLPRKFMEWVGRALKGNEVLTNLDHTARANYEERMRHTIEDAPPVPTAPVEVPAAAAPAVAEAGAPAPEAQVAGLNGGDDAEAAEREKEAV